MLESFESGLEGWLTPGISALAAVALTLLLYRLAVLVTRRFMASTTVIRQFLEAASGSLGAFLCLLAFNAVLRAAPADLPALGGIQRLTTLLGATLRSGV